MAKYTITIPALPKSKTAIGQNYVEWEPTKPVVTQVEIEDSKLEGYFSVTTSLNPPFDVLYLRKKGGKKEPTDCATLVTKIETSLDNFDENTVLVWEETEQILGQFDTPDKIINSWSDSFKFQKAVEENGVLGLRAPQIGALHAISAHFSVGQAHDEATVVLPTGTGKTETMLAALIYERPNKLLVLVPSDALRSQIGNKFVSLGILRDLGCVPAEIIGPKVTLLKKGLQTKEEAEAILESSNVVVVLPNFFSASNLSAVDALCAGCTDLFIDEAHHVKASTWSEIKSRFQENRVTQFTATPFRNDRKHIGGKIVFNYKLSDAQNDNYYKPIRLNSVEEFGEEDVRNRVIAEKAVAILRSDLEDGFDHLLMARVKDKSKAEEIHSLYQEIAPEFNPVVVFSGPGKKMANEAALGALKGLSEPKSRIVICVNMLGEGFDLPQLKIAAIHDNHKSLAVTLQFIGRFTRNAEDVGDAAVVINTADANAEKALENLYSEGADWDQIISRLSEDRIEDELRLQDIVESLKSKGDLHDKISLWNLNPSLSMQVYKTQCEDWSPLDYLKALPRNGEYWHSISEEKNILIVVGYQENAVKWGRYEELHETSYDLLIAHWNKEEGVLFVNSSSYDRMKTVQVAKAITSDETTLLTGPQVFNVLNNVELPLAKSLGSSRLGAISFTSYFGPNVTEGLANIEKSEAQLNNIACLGYEDGEKVVWGAAQKKGKIGSKKVGASMSGSTGPMKLMQSWQMKLKTKLTLQETFCGPKRLMLLTLFRQFQFSGASTFKRLFLIGY